MLRGMDINICRAKECVLFKCSCKSANLWSAIRREIWRLYLLLVKNMQLLHTEVKERMEQAEFNTARGVKEMR